MPVDAPLTADPEVVLDLLRAAMRQYGAFLQTQIAIEKALGLEGESEVRDHIVELAPEFVDYPNRLTTDHVESLLRLFSRPKND